MWYLVEGLSEIHDDHIRLSVTPAQSSIQVTNHVMKELNQLGFARPLTTETMLTVNKNIFKCLFILLTIISSKVLQQVQVGDTGQ